MAGDMLSSAKPHASLLRRRERGNMALVAALATVPLAAAAGYAVEVAGIASARATLQSAADSAALAGAGELSVLSRGDAGIIQTARNHALSQVPGLSVEAAVAFDASVNRSDNSVTVIGVAERPSSFGFLGADSVRIEVSATAAFSQSSPLCILQTRHVLGDVGIRLDDRSNLRAPTCLVHGNSDIEVRSSATMTAGIIQSAGAVTGTVQGNAGAMTVTDPFASLDLNPPTTCPANPPPISANGNDVVTLSPGVHCAEIQVNGNASVLLLPGEHWFLGELQFGGNSRLRGDDVVLIFGRDDAFNFGEGADVELTARRSGALAGFLIATSRDNDEIFTITSDRVKELLGTIYIPNAELIIRTKGNVAQDSAWSVIVAERLTLLDSPTLVINTGYVGSGVPVPDGVGPSAGPMRLVR